MTSPIQSAPAMSLARIAQVAAAWARTPAGGLVLLIAITAMARLVFAATLGLGIDESYMVAAGRHIRLGYFDHPPIAWWLAWAAAHIAGSDAAVVVRAPFIALFALTTWLMYRLTATLFDRRAGLWAAALANLCPVIGVTAASWVLPDGPLFAALLAAAWCLVAALPAEGGAAWGWWLGSGLCAGLAMSSKYSAGLTVLGVLCFLVTEPQGRCWLRRPHPYIAGLVALGVFAPVLWWNAQHGWVSFLFQGGRVGGRLDLLGPIRTLAGEALFVLPWLWLPLVLCGFDALRRGPAEMRGWLLLCLAAPPIVLFTLVALWGHVLFHWAAPGYLFLLPLLGAAIAGDPSHRARARRWLMATTALVVCAMTVVATDVRFDWLPSIAHLDPSIIRLDPAIFHLDKDPAIAAVDWTSLARELEARGLVGQPGLVIAATRWLDAGKIDYALEGRMPVICLGDDPREYGIIAPVAAYAGADVLIVAPGVSAADITARFGGMFRSIATLPPATLLHDGRPALSVPLYLGHDLRPSR
ncbi:MAG TPA: glycosyltransferase family 39 protein [Stellaceae bacterium]|nr:glycosyltransferase family 39 protein [Stellaceae bacterium]